MPYVKTMQLSILVTLTLAAYLAVKDHQFVWDTIPFVLENPWVHEWSVANVTSMFTEVHRANWHPVVLLSHTVDFSLFGMDSGSHHLINVLFHALNAVLIYCLVMLMLASAPVNSHPLSESLFPWTAFLTALIFALHPQHVESVAWVVERKDVLYTLFTLACFISYLKLENQKSTDVWSKLWPFLWFCLALGAKPMAVTIPAILVLVDLLHLKKQPLTLIGMTRAVVRRMPYFLLALVVALLTLETQSGAMPSIQALPFWAQALNAIDNSYFYIEHYSWPLSLSPYYPWQHTAEQMLAPSFWLPGVIFLTGFSSLCLYQLGRGNTAPALLFGFYVVTLLPASGIIHVGPAKATDHYVYLATLPLSFITAWVFVYTWYLASRVRPVIIGLGLAYIIFLFALTQQQVTYWQNELSLWGRVTTLYPGSAFAHRNLAAALVAREQWQLALHHAELSLQLGSEDEAYVLRLREAVEEANLKPLLLPGNHASSQTHH